MNIFLNIIMNKNSNFNIVNVNVDYIVIEQLKKFCLKFRSLKI